jgi:hypothetical protein
MEQIDQDFKRAIEFDDYLEERKGKCQAKCNTVSGAVPNLAFMSLITETSKPAEQRNVNKRPAMNTALSKKNDSTSPKKTITSDIDPCGRCGCQRKYHNPEKSEKGYKASRFMGPVQPPHFKITARSCCATCPYCICFCVGFVEPSEGQPYQRCVYEA